MIREKVGLGTAAQRAVGTGTNQIPDMNSFISGSNGNGVYGKLPNGTQYCRNIITIAAGGSVTWTFPSTFASQPLVTQPIAINPSVAMPSAFWTTGISPAGVTYFNPNSAGASIDVFAIL